MRTRIAGSPSQEGCGRGRSRRRATDPDLAVATKLAIQEMVDFLAATKQLTRHQAYQLVSIAGNVAVTQLVDKPNVGVHVKLPNSLFAGARHGGS